MRAYAISFLAIGLCHSAGCSDPTGKEYGRSNSAVAKTQPRIDPAEDSAVAVPHPEYTNWSQFPEGTRLIRQKVVENPNGAITETTTLKLVEKREAAVVIETQVTVVRDSVELKNEPNQVSFPSTFRLPSGFTREQFEIPSQKAKFQEEVSVTIGDRSYPCKLYSWTESNEAGPMPVKVWFSDRVPGRLVKQESFIESSKTRSVEEVQSIEIPKPTQ